MPTDWIEDFLDSTDTFRSPRSFRLWSAISCISAILERKVWTVTDQPEPLCPNQIIILAGAPASGKSIMAGVMKSMISGIKGLHMGPDKPTPESFMDALDASTKEALPGSPIMHSAMTTICTEFRVLFPKYDEPFMASLTDLYDNKPIFTMPRRTTKSLTIENPTINILACVTPDTLGSTLPELAWGEGFCSRAIFIYGAIPQRERNMFRRGKKENLDQLRKQLDVWYRELRGEFVWDDEAQAAINHWYNKERLGEEQSHKRLVNYNSRRDTHAMKLSMISAVSAGRGLYVTKDDFLRARQWLLDAEKEMPDIFRAMGAKSDVQLLQDAHVHLWRLYSVAARDKRRPIPERKLYEFFEEKTTSDKITGLITMLEKLGRIRKKPGTEGWIVNPLDQEDGI